MTLYVNKLKIILGKSIKVYTILLLAYARKINHENNKEILKKATYGNG